MGEGHAFQAPKHGAETNDMEHTRVLASSLVALTMIYTRACSDHAVTSYDLFAHSGFLHSGWFSKDNWVLRWVEAHTQLTTILGEVGHHFVLVQNKYTGISFQHHNLWTLEYSVFRWLLGNVNPEGIRCLKSVLNLEAEPWQSRRRLLQFPFYDLGKLPIPT